MALSDRPRRRPNVILFITDDQGYGDLGCHGNPLLRTPHLDGLHRASIRLTNFHVDPTCSPTRAALLTGRYSHRAGVWHTIMGRNFLPRDEVTMAQVFKAAGYRTGIFGKWHLGGNYPFRPIDRGFDQWVGHGDGGTGTATDYWGNDKMNDTYLRNGRWEAFKGFCTDIYFDEAMAFIEADAGAPFFVYLPTNVPHGPWNLPEGWAKPYLDSGVPPARAYFFATIERADHNLGRLRRFLETRGLAQDTIVIFLTDNGTSGGCALDRNGFVTNGFNAGMRGRKGSEYDGGHRVPCFIHWPGGGLNRGRNIDRLAAHVDLMPTLIDLCGLAKPDGVAFDGTSLVPLLGDPAATWPDRTLLVESQRIPVPKPWRQCAVMTDRWRLVGGKELYDMTADPGQRRDVAGDHADVVERLRGFYEQTWPGLSRRDGEFARPIIGSDRQAVTWLVGHDWMPTQGGNPWDQRGHILPGLVSNGFWPVEIARDGTYEFTLRRWPQEVDAPITAPLPPQTEGDLTAGGPAGPRPVRMGPGTAIRATRARLKVGDHDQAKAIPAGATAVAFAVELKAGPTRVETWFDDPSSGQSRGAYYVYARRV